MFSLRSKRRFAEARLEVAHWDMRTSFEPHNVRYKVQSCFGCSGELQKASRKQDTATREWQWEDMDAVRAEMREHIFNVLEHFLNSAGTNVLKDKVKAPCPERVF